MRERGFFAARQHSAKAPCTLCRIHCCTHGSLHLDTLQRHPASRYSATAPCTSVLCSGTLHLLQDPSLHPRLLHREIGGSRQLSSLKLEIRESTSIAAHTALCSGTLHPLQNLRLHLLPCLPSNSVVQSCGPEQQVKSFPPSASKDFCPKLFYPKTFA